MFEQLGLIGCGLMGGSFALALKKQAWYNVSWATASPHYHRPRPANGGD